MSEFRQDLVSGDWIIVAPERAKRPHDFLIKKKRFFAPKSKCVFENLEKSGNWPPILSYPNDKNWKAVIIPNKYPALRHLGACPTPTHQGLYNSLGSVGHHDLVITRDHKKNLAHMSVEEGVELLGLIQKRFRQLAKDSCMRYVSTFFNWGPSVGASISHPHYQILALPIIPPDVKRSLEGSHKYFSKNHSCVHCDILRYECKTRKRIIKENNLAVSVSPFVSHRPFEVRIYPKTHGSSFEKANPRTIRAIAVVLRDTLQKIEKYLKDPDLNFFIHTAPVKTGDYRHYHWHIEVIPNIFIRAGFELGTDIDIDVIDPDRATDILRGDGTKK